VWDVREVAHVVCDHDPALPLRGGEEQRVVELLQVVAEAGGDDGVTAVGVQEQAQRLIARASASSDAKSRESATISHTSRPVPSTQARRR
jgi:hypothetical protein